MTETQTPLRRGFAFLGSVRAGLALVEVPLGILPGTEPGHWRLSWSCRALGEVGTEVLPDDA